MKTKPVFDPLPGMADELGSLQKELAPLAGKIARHDALKAAMREAVSDRPANDNITVDGERFTVHIGPRGWQSTVNIAGFLKLVGAKTFATVATVTQKSAATVAPNYPYDSSQTGPRSLKVFERGQ